VVRHQHQPSQSTKGERGKKSVISQRVPQNEYKQRDDAENKKLLQAQRTFQRTGIHGA
jgi:hypothetical protein